MKALVRWFLPVLVPKEQYIPASGGLAKFAGSRASNRGEKSEVPVRKSLTPDALNAAFLAKQDAKTYRGFTLGKTHTGEWFSSLDPDSWYDSAAQVRRAIDGYLKGRAA